VVRGQLKGAGKRRRLTEIAVGVPLARCPKGPTIGQARGLLCAAGMLAPLAVALLTASSVEASPEYDDGTADTSSPVARVGASTAGALAATLAVGVSSFVAFFGIWAATGFDGLGNGRDMTGFWAAIGTGAALDVLGGVLLIPLGAWVGEQEAGGRGTYGAAVAGGAAGLAVAAACIAGGVGLGFVQHWEGAVLMGAGIAAALAGPVIGLEVSHHVRTAPRVGVAPQRGGAAFSLSWAL
jgi:hypothetical protein